MAVRRVMRPTKPHFFRPLEAGFQHQLLVPVAFYLKYFKEKNPEEAVLRSPSGKLWRVKMNERSFEDGWKEFCEDHGLHVGDFLVFRHVEDLMFDVMVFDRSTCRRNYPSNLSVKEEIFETPPSPPPQQEEEETPKQQSPEQLTKKRKKGMTKFERKAGPSVRKDIKETPPQDEAAPKESAGKWVKKKGMTKFEGKAGPLDSQYPHFMLTLSRYSAKCSCLNIPMPFARENGLDSQNCKIVLLNEQGKVWMSSIGIKQRDGQAYIREIWAAFCVANSLKAGDSCIFELIRDGEKPVLKITKFNPNSKPEKGSTNNVAQAGSSSRNPCVHITVKEAYMKNNLLRIPTRFATKSGLTRRCREQMTLQNEKGRSWTVSLQKRTTGGVRIGLGWSTFVMENGIKEGDVLKLELIKGGNKLVMRISGAKRGAESSKKKRSGTPVRVKADSQIKQEANIM